MTTPPPPSTGTETDTRTRLLDAGAELFTAKGFNGTGLSEILQLAKVPRGSFYHYFASKKEFAIVLIERTRDDFIEELRPLLSDRRISPLQRLRRTFEHVRECCGEAGPTVECLITKIALETGNLSEPVHAAVKCTYQQWSALLAQAIREGQAAGEIEAHHDPDRLADVLTMLWEGAVMRMQIDREPARLDEFLDYAFDAILRPPSR